MGCAWGWRGSQTLSSRRKLWEAGPREGSQAAEGAGTGRSGAGPRRGSPASGGEPSHGGGSRLAGRQPALVRTHTRCSRRVSLIVVESGLP